MLGVFANVDPLRATFPSEQPDAVLVDLGMPQRAAIASVLRLKSAWPKLRIIVLSDRHDPELVLEAFRAGADGCYSKRESAGNIMNGIVESLKGGSPISAEAARSIVTGLQMKGVATLETDALTERERQIFECLSRGLSYIEIGAALRIAQTTVNDHLKNIYRKLDVHSRAEAVAKCLNAGG